MASELTSGTKKMRIRTASLALGVVTASLLLDGLAAYSIAGVPLPRLAPMLLLVGVGVVVTRWKLRWDVLLTGLSIFISVSMFASLVHLWIAPIPIMPGAYDGGYLQFLVTRYMNLAGYAAMVALALNYSLRGDQENLKSSLFKLSIVFSVAALYIYASQIIGLWEPPRTRTGTGGQDYSSVAVEFSYAFHRALGTFREPSHFAQWIAAPVVMSFVAQGAPARVLRVVGSLALLLSGSLLGISMVAAGATLLIAFGSMGKRLKFALVVLAVFGLLVPVLGMLGLDLIGVVGKRILAIMSDGVEGSNRAYMYSYLIGSVPPILGCGFGNASIALSEYFSNPVMMSHQSLFVNMFYSMGLVGLVFSVWFVMMPIIRLIRLARLSQDALMYGAGLLVWIPAYFAHAEELTLMHAALVGCSSATIYKILRRRMKSSG